MSRHVVRERRELPPGRRLSRDLDREVEADVDLRLPERGLTAWLGRGRAVCAATMLALFLVSQFGKSPEENGLIGSAGPLSPAETTVPAAGVANSPITTSPGLIRNEIATRDVGNSDLGPGGGGESQRERDTRIGSDISMSPAAAETEAEQLARISNHLAKGLEPEVGLRLRVFLRDGPGLRSGVDPDGTVFLTRPLVRELRTDDSWVAALAAMEIGAAVLPEAGRSTDDLIRFALRLLRTTGYDPQSLGKMAEWIVKTSSLGTRDGITPEMFTARVQELLVEPMVTGRTETR